MANWPTQKEAKKLFEFFSAGTSTDFILLGDPAEQDVHFVNSKGHKILCTADTGSCDSCQVCGVNSDISDPQTEYYAPAMRLKKDRRYHQCVAVISNKMWHEDLKVLLSDGPARGHRFTLHRKSTQKWTISPAKTAPRSLALALPESFEVLPWVRARFNRPQDPLKPAVRLEPFWLRDLDAGRGTAARPKRLELTADDRLSADEFEAMKAKLAEAKTKFDAAPGASAAATPEPTLAPAGMKKIEFLAPQTDPEEIARNAERREAANGARLASLGLDAESGPGTNRLPAITQAIDALSEAYRLPDDRKPLAPSLNGRHAGKKGGGL